MLFLKIYIGFSVLTFFVILMQTYILTKQFKRKYPDTIQELGKNNKSGFLERLFECIRILIICFIPIMNLCLFIVVLFKTEEVEERTFQRVQKRIKAGK